MNVSEKWMIIWFTPHQNMHHPPEMDVLPKTFLQIIIAANGLEAFNNVTQTAATTFAFSSACFFSYDPDIIPS